VITVEIPFDELSNQVIYLRVFGGRREKNPDKERSTASIFGHYGIHREWARVDLLGTTGDAVTETHGATILC
jgi:hypothetical protein